MPKSVVRCSTKTPVSWKEPGSSRRSIRSRAVSLPSAWSFSIRSLPPPSRTSCRRRLSSSMGFRGVRFVASCPTPDVLEAEASYRKQPPRAMRPASMYNGQDPLPRRTLAQEPRMPRSKSSTAARERRLDRINWMEFAEIVPRHMNTALLPVGTLEAHGVTSLGTDNEIPTRLSEAIAERLNALVAPTIPFGVTAHLGALAGGTHVPAPAFTEYVIAVIAALAHQGIQNVIVMNGHGGNTEALREATRRAHEETGGVVAVVNWWVEKRPYVREMLRVPGRAAGAGGAAA